LHAPHRRAVDAALPAEPVRELGGAVSGPASARDEAERACAGRCMRGPAGRTLAGLVPLDHARDLEPPDGWTPRSAHPARVRRPVLLHRWTCARPGASGATARSVPRGELAPRNLNRGGANI